MTHSLWHQTFSRPLWEAFCTEKSSSFVKTWNIYIDRIIQLRVKVKTSNLNLENYSSNLSRERHFLGGPATLSRLHGTIMLTEPGVTWINTFFRRDFHHNFASLWTWEKTGGSETLSHEVETVTALIEYLNN